jgi:PKD repeat protein
MSTGLEVNFVGSSENATTHFWDFGDGSSSSEENPFHIYSSPGTYTIQHIASSSCGADTSTFDLMVTISSVADPDPLDEIKVVVQSNNITLSNGRSSYVSLTLIDLSGREVLSETLGSNSTTSIDVNLNRGVYLIRLEDGINRSTRKVLLQ